jgi:hypothetical protein
LRTFDDIKIGCTIIQDKNDIYSVTREFDEKWVMSSRPNDSTMIGYGGKADPIGSVLPYWLQIVVKVIRSWWIIMNSDELIRLK